MGSFGQKHLEPVQKYSCEIITSNPKAKQVEGIMRTGPVHISVFTTDPFFRWPKTGESWLVRKENGSWYLDSILQGEEDPVRLKDLEPGDGFINVPGKIHTNTGTTVTRKYIQTVGDGSTKEFTISHGLNDTWLNVGVQKTAAPYSPISIEWHIKDTNSIVVIFGSAPATKGAQVVVIG